MAVIQSEGRKAALTLPVGLILEGRSCLVVGAGKVAVRKIGHLIEASARVTVVGVDAADSIREWQTQSVIRLESRVFQDGDVTGHAVVFAATNDANANLRVLEACRREGVLCGCVDFHWRESDLISPAVLRMDDLTVAVSTGGRSCRRSRLVRDSLARHLSGINTSDLLVIGTSHQQISLRQLESLALTGERLEGTGRLLGGIWGIHEFLLLSTCNRVEIWALASTGADVHELLRRVLGFGALERDAYYIKQGFDAFEHTSLLAAGLLSQTLGESHIVAQLKNAIDIAERSGWSGSILRAWTSHVLHVSKDIRAGMADLVPGGDVEERVLGLLAAWRPGFRDGPGMVIGTGAVGNRLVEQLMARPGTGRLFWCYRTRPPEIRSEWKTRVEAIEFSKIGSALSSVGYVIAAAGGAEPILRAGHASMLSGADEVLIVDLGMPHNVGLDFVAQRARTRILDLDDLTHQPDCEVGAVARAIELGQRTINEHRDLYDTTIRNIQDRHTDE